MRPRLKLLFWFRRMMIRSYPQPARRHGRERRPAGPPWIPPAQQARALPLQAVLSRRPT
ncbi:hypothetical protein BN2476_210142 [Paraburkholderia piptadeniae]|uniref:Uncharacterized protein n=1 Tax=Paraburkholderia piptadeniae TaxID=1701573 RepID=A0A1N7RW74_9BURK|nr:hypothetical protein BN2476_210142 [Paraburkholderia piptadeniae]